MSIPSNQKTAEHLMHLIVNRNGKVPNFSLLLGSGASATSGVRTAQDMIGEWRKLLFSRSDGKRRYEEWLAGQTWFKHEDEYSMLFEEIYDQPSQRRVYVEECVKESHPSWGYVYLTNLLTEKFFDVVFTTNFDDLINEACYLYSDGLRPIVAAHDSAVQGIRVTSDRPKIIKLHGDFLYDNIKNTLSELETLETNMKRKFNQFAQEYGLVVLGYSGRDRSVMDTLELLLRDEENYKQGMYWCHQSGATISGRLHALLRKDRVYLVEIKGFDEFVAELHNAAQLTLPRLIARPFDMARERARRFLNIGEPLSSHPVIGRHVKEVEESIRSPKLPLPIEAAILSARGEPEGILMWEKAYSEDPDDTFIAYGYADALANAGKYKELSEFAAAAPLSVQNKTYFFLRAGANQEVIDLATEMLIEPDDEDERDSRAVSRINRAIALKRLGRTEEMMLDLKALEQNGDTERSNIRAGVAALKGDREGMFEALSEALHNTIAVEHLLEFPVFEEYRDDPDFLRFVEEGRTKE